ncbi:MAG: hypothetical protein ACREJM_01605 [Candidatus Saccharimonadales bacterium]
MTLLHDLSLLTREQTEFCVRFFAARPLADLRGRQQLTERQIGWAVEHQNDFALANLRVREEILRLAAERKLPTLAGRPVGAGRRPSEALVSHTS